MNNIELLWAANSTVAERYNAEKHEASKALLMKIWEEGGGVVCLQNLMDFLLLSLKKLRIQFKLKMPGLL
jgi:hypothetical protein